MTPPCEVTLPLLQLGPYVKPLFENGVFFFIVLRPNRPRALEGHMFIEMRQSGLTYLFVDSPDSKGHVDRDHRRLMPFDHEHGQPVRQRLFHHTVCKPERGGMRWDDSQAEAQNNKDTSPEDIEAARTT